MIAPVLQADAGLLIEEASALKKLVQNLDL